MEFDNITLKATPGLCRCCLSEGCYKELGTEYNWMGESEVYSDMLMECFDISISQHNDGPNGLNRLICEVCITRLRDAFIFKKQVLESENKFVDMLGRGHYKSKLMVFNVKHEAPQDEVVVQSEEECIVEYLDEEMDFTGDNDDDITKIIEIKAPVRNEEAAVLSIGSSRKRPKISSVTVKNKSGSSRALEKVKIVKEKTGIKIVSADDEYKKAELKRKLSIKRRNVEYVLQYSNVTPFMWYRSKFRCFYCTEPIKDPDILREHTRTVHQLANLELVVHDRTKSNRNKDAAVKIDVTDLACKLCSEKMDNLEGLLHHLIIAHDAEYDMSVANCLLPFKLDKDNPSCATCGMKFLFFVYLLKHANKHHLSHNYMCDICGTSFQGENHLQMHHRYYHREGGYNCGCCGLSLNTLSRKILHEKNVHHVKLLTCPQCPETFKSSYFKKIHLANVHGVEELKIKCPYCSKVYPQEGIMSRHMRRVHLREKNVECEVCGDKFFGAYDVKLHMIKHNGEKKYMCNVCGKRFSKKSNLNSHSIIHTGVKKYVCQICDKQFAHHANFKAHVKSIHPEYEIVDQNLEIVKQDPEIVGNFLDSEVVHMEFISNEGLMTSDLTSYAVQ